MAALAAAAARSISACEATMLAEMMRRWWVWKEWVAERARP